MQHHLAAVAAAQRRAEVPKDPPLSKLTAKPPILASSMSCGGAFQALKLSLFAATIFVAGANYLAFANGTHDYDDGFSGEENFAKADNFGVQRASDAAAWPGRECFSERSRKCAHSMVEMIAADPSKMWTNSEGFHFDSVAEFTVDDAGVNGSCCIKRR